MSNRQQLSPPIKKKKNKQQNVLKATGFISNNQHTNPCWPARMENKVAVVARILARDMAEGVFSVFSSQTGSVADAS